MAVRVPQRPVYASGYLSNMQREHFSIQRADFPRIANHSMAMRSPRFGRFRVRCSAQTSQSQ
jgi:hypothetical protein